MDDLELAKRIEDCRADYAAVYGQSCENFFCPILLKGEKAELIRGHIVNEPLKSSSEWVPQRKDVDGFYGSVVEPEFIAIIQDREAVCIMRRKLVEYDVKRFIHRNRGKIGPPQLLHLQQRQGFAIHQRC